MREPIRIIGLDLDGTLLNNNKRISPRTMAALEAAQAQGVYLVPVTGRPHLGVPRLVRELPFVRYLISCNGAAIRDNITDDLVRERVIEPSLALRVLEVLRRFDAPHEALCHGQGYGEDWVYREMIAMHPDNHFLPVYIRDSRKTVPDMAEFLAGSSGLEEFFLMTKSREQRDEIAAALVDVPGISIVFPAARALEITAAGVDKGEALLYLAQYLGVSPQGVMAVGDSGNDLAMLQAAALPVAMGNAAQKVKDMAAHITATNEEDGVGLAIEEFVLV